MKIINHRLTSAATVALVVLTATNAAAQSRGRVLVDDVKNTVGDMVDVWTSPLRATGKDWFGVAGTIAVAAAISPLDASVDRWAVNNRNDKAFDFLKPVREGGDAFSGRTITPVAVGALLVGVAVKSEPLQDGLWGCVGAYSASSVVRTFVLEQLLARTRPDSSHSIQTPPAKNGDQYHFKFPGGSDWGRHAFPGGHFSNVASCAGFLTSRFHMGWAAPIPWVVAGSVALGRTLDRRHWLSDEVVGGVLGYATGKEVALRQKRRHAKKANGGNNNDDDDSGPFLGADGSGAKLGWRLTW